MTYCCAVRSATAAVGNTRSRIKYSNVCVRIAPSRIISTFVARRFIDERFVANIYRTNACESRRDSRRCLHHSPNIRQPRVNAFNATNFFCFLGYDSEREGCARSTNIYRCKKKKERKEKRRVGHRRCADEITCMPASTNNVTLRGSVANVARHFRNFM